MTSSAVSTIAIALAALAIIGTVGSFAVMLKRLNAALHYVAETVREVNAAVNGTGPDEPSIQENVREGREDAVTRGRPVTEALARLESKVDGLDAKVDRIFTSEGE